jgi:hypothetical protein
MIGRLLCRIGLHRSNYRRHSSIMYPGPIRCERCRTVLR